MNQANVHSRGLINSPAVVWVRRPGTILAIIILVALASFEVFNFSTTEFALNDLLGGLKFAGIGWSTILTVAFCCIDFAGIARLFTPEQGQNEPREVWYLFGAWFLAATMNALLTWWGVAIAISNHALKSTSVMDAKTLITVVPVFVAMMVWLIRILIIGTISMAGERFLEGDSRPRRYSAMRHNQIVGTTESLSAASAQTPAYTRPILPRPVSRSQAVSRPEPTYHQMGGSQQVEGSTLGGEIARQDILQ